MALKIYPNYMAKIYRYYCNRCKKVIERPFKKKRHRSFCDQTMAITYLIRITGKKAPKKTTLKTKKTKR